MIDLRKIDMNFLRPLIYNDLIRVGSKGDGGYLLPKEVIKDIKYCLSFGIGYNHEFESHLHKKIKGLRVIGFDHTVGVKFFMRLAFNGLLKLLILKGSFKEFSERNRRLLGFISFWVISGNHKHNRTKISKSNVEKIINSFELETCLLKIDIEGSEWEIWSKIDEDIQSIACLIIEFHHVRKNIAQLKEIVDNLKQTHNIAHLHINNFSPQHNIGVPDFIELTFVRKDYKSSGLKRKKLPIINLDRKTMPNLDDFSIVFEN